MSVVALILAASMNHSGGIEPVLWLNPSGRLTIDGQEAHGKLSPGTREVSTPLGTGLDFAGGRSGFLLEDAPVFKLTRSLTVATWVYLRKYTSNGWQAQLLMRGDDRPGLDPYHLTLENGGTVSFGIDSQEGVRTEVRTELPRNTWVRVTGSYDAEGRELKLWINNRLVSTALTPRQPFPELESRYTPGIGIGNVESDRGGNNQAMDGTVVDMRVYNAALEPVEAGYKRFAKGE